MGLYTNVHATKPQKQNTAQVDFSQRGKWMAELRAAVNPRESGWSNFTEAMQNNGLFILDSDNNRINFCKPVALGVGDDAAVQQIQEMMQAGAEGRLFLRLKDTDLVMQLKTQTLTQDECNLEMSAAVRDIPGVEGISEAAQPALEKPESPSILAHIIAFFAPNSEYGKQVAAYKAAKARYNDFRAGFAKLPEPKAVSAPAVNEVAGQNVQLQNEGIQPENQEQLENKVQQGEQQKDQEYPSRGLNPYSEENVKAAADSMTLDEKTVAKVLPENCPLQYNGKQLGTLAAMAMGNPDLHVTSARTGEKVFNKPDVYYKEVVGNRYLQNLPTSKTAAGLNLASRSAVYSALKSVTETGDYSKLAKIIACGLKQNNKMLQEQKELSDIYTGYANLGARAMKIMNANEELKQAVMDQLGPDAEQQIKIAKAAKNISDLRVKAMKVYHKMEKDFHVFGDVRTYDDDGKVIMNKRAAATYTTADIALIALANNIDLDMNFKKFELDGNKYAEPKEINDIVNDYARTEVMSDFLKQENRGELFKDPLKMKELYGAATDELKDSRELKKFERGLGKENEDLYIDNNKLVEDKIKDVGAFLYGDDFNAIPDQNNEPIAASVTK